MYGQGPSAARGCGPFSEAAGAAATGAGWFVLQELQGFMGPGKVLQGFVLGLFWVSFGSLRSPVRGYVYMLS